MTNEVQKNSTMESFKNYLNCPERGRIKSSDNGENTKDDVKQCDSVE